MRLLEVFCGTKSMSNVFQKSGWETHTIDIDNRFNPSECINVLDFNYTKFNEHHFDHLHFSPPCQYMSQNQQTWYNRHKGRGNDKYLFTREIHNEKLIESDKLLHKIKDIIDYFNKATFTIENPHHNKFNCIKNRGILGYDYTLCDYCMYEYPLKKPTIFYNNFGLELKTCDKSHVHCNWDNYKGGGTDPYSRYKIPEVLCSDVFAQLMLKAPHNSCLKPHTESPDT